MSGHRTRTASAHGGWRPGHVLPSRPSGETALQTSRSQTSSLQNQRHTFLLRKPLSLWYLSWQPQHMDILTLKFLFTRSLPLA